MIFHLLEFREKFDFDAAKMVKVLGTYVSGLYVRYVTMT
jgi:hypothetical protein